MAIYTTYKNLEKPDISELYNINVANKNNDIIDSELHKIDLNLANQNSQFASKQDLNSEISRATAKENEIASGLASEISRATAAENKNCEDLADETDRATTAENDIRISIQNHTDNTVNPHNVTKAQIGLGNADNTSDMDKPVSTAQQNALDAAISAHNSTESAHHDIRILLENKVDKVSGMGLSENDYTTADKNKLDGIASGANVNVQPDWDVTDTGSDAFIKNKPTSLPASDVPDWAKAEEKPTYTKEDIGLGNVPNVSTDDQTPNFTPAAERTNISSGEKLSVILGKVKKWFSDLTAVAFSGSYNDLSDKPTIPVKTSQLTNDSGFITTDNDTWRANTISSEGYVAPGSGHANQVWKTDADGNPDWREEIPLTESLSITESGISALDAIVGKILDDKGAQMSVYKGDDENLHFRDWTGADTVIPFSSGNDETIKNFLTLGITVSNTPGTLWIAQDASETVTGNDTTAILSNISSESDNTISCVDGAKYLIGDIFLNTEDAGTPGCCWIE